MGNPFLKVSFHGGIEEDSSKLLPYYGDVSISSNSGTTIIYGNENQLYDATHNKVRDYSKVLKNSNRNIYRNSMILRIGETKFILLHHYLYHEKDIDTIAFPLGLYISVIDFNKDKNVYFMDTNRLNILLKKKNYNCRK